MKYFDLQQRNSLLCIILVLGLIILDGIMFLWRNFKGDLKKEEMD
jgi:cytochrome bd-type quinol oxidase subunit 2